jgi:hypothetical protein
MHWWAAGPGLTSVGPEERRVQRRLVPPPGPGYWQPARLV